MKKTEDQIKPANVAGDTVPEGLGISPERLTAVTKRTQQIIKNNISDNKHKSDIICDVWNEFENPVECAFALYILTHNEEEIMVHELFRLPQEVADKEEA